MEVFPKGDQMNLQLQPLVERLEEHSSGSPTEPFLLTQREVDCLLELLIHPNGVPRKELLKAQALAISLLGALDPDEDLFAKLRLALQTSPEDQRMALVSLVGSWAIRKRNPRALEVVEDRGVNDNSQMVRVLALEIARGCYPEHCQPLRTQKI